jgi:hypothetical protein
VSNRFWFSKALIVTSYQRLNYFNAGILMLEHLLVKAFLDII